MFSYVIDTTRVNTSTSFNGLTTLARQKIELVIGKRQWEVEGEAVGRPMSDNKERCHICTSNLAGGRA